MENELENQINCQSEKRAIHLSGAIKLNKDKGRSFLVGKNCVKGIISVTRPDIVIDGSDAEIEVDVEDCTENDWSLFYFKQSARNVILKNVNIFVHIKNPVHTTRMFSAIYNTAYGLKLQNCHIEVYADKQINLAGIYNNGNLDTHLETRADNLAVSDCYIKTECRTDEYPKECAIYGVYNYLANSISVQNTFIYATNMGNGEMQKAIGVYTDGRFGRFVGNNIKANGTHNIGKLKEQAHAYGFENEGLYSIITSNNIVGEWSGASIGLENKGAFAKVSSNKILATHTICGRSIRNFAEDSIFDGNILTSTSRNARLFEQRGNSCIIKNNLMEVLMPIEECQSGCGIYIGKEVMDNIISDNIIKNVKDCAIFASLRAGRIEGNLIESCGNMSVIERAGEENSLVADRLDERNIRSIYE